MDSSTHTLSSIKHLQLITNGIIKDSPKVIDCNLILKSLKTNDEYLIQNLNNQMQTIISAKLNLMCYVLKNGLVNKNNVIDVMKSINKLFVSNGFSSFKFKKICYEDIGEKLIIHSSILKDNYYEKQYLIEQLTKLFERSGLANDFMKLTNKRFSKTIDLLFVL